MSATGTTELSVQDLLALHELTNDALLRFFAQKHELESMLFANLSTRRAAALQLQVQLRNEVPDDESEEACTARLQALSRLKSLERRLAEEIGRLGTAIRHTNEIKTMLTTSEVA
jgi:hypothetical protein